MIGKCVAGGGSAVFAFRQVCILIHPDFIIGTPVGFVNVVESKELICQSDVPCIVARGRKGGSNIAAAVCNALMYQVTRA